MEPITRRRLLGGCSAGVAVGGAGCSGRDGETSPDGTARDGSPSPDGPRGVAGFVRPDDEPPSVSPLNCERDGSERSDPVFDDVIWGGPADGESALALRVDALEYERGDEATVTLTNTGTGRESTGNRRTFSFELRTEAGWQEGRVHPADEPIPCTDIGILHEPGTGFEWPLPLDAEATDDRFSVCPGLPTGRYRFVYWGANPSLAVAFDPVDGEPDTATPRSPARRSP
jgi:hypothetical protein